MNIFESACAAADAGDRSFEPVGGVRQMRVHYGTRRCSCCKVPKKIKGGTFAGKGTGFRCAECRTK